MFRSLFSVAAVAWTASAVPAQKRAPEGVPKYVLDYAPLVHLFSGEQYFPSDLGAQLTHTTPETNFTAVSNAPKPLTLDNLNSLGSNVYLTSNDDITKNPDWLKGVKPDSSGKTGDAVSSAIIVNDKGSGNVDAFYMYFYAYNWGGIVAGLKSLQFDDHVGDWEHNMVRFENGSPKAVWYSQHAGGEAFSYDATEKQGNRPIAYSGNGSHAVYAISGNHDHSIPGLNLPGGVLEDHTDKGALWDPTLSAYFYKYDAGANSFKAYDTSGKTPTGWLDFKGRWGDQEYPKSDKRQEIVFKQAKYTTGPTGPADKNLNRNHVCPDSVKDCIVRPVLTPKDKQS